MWLGESLIPNPRLSLGIEDEIGIRWDKIPYSFKNYEEK